MEDDYCFAEDLVKGVLFSLWLFSVALIPVAGAWILPSVGIFWFCLAVVDWFTTEEECDGDN